MIRHLKARWIALLFCLAALALPVISLAQTTGGTTGTTGVTFTAGGAGDYTDTLNAVQTDLAGFFSTNGPILIGALLIMVTFGLVWRLIRRVGRSA